MRSATQALFVACAVLSSPVAIGQTREPDKIPPKGEEMVPPDRPSGSTTMPDTGPRGSLSDELNRSGGVLQPPSTGDKGAVSPPDIGEERMPVIPPPGSPGGDGRVQPK